MDRFASVCPSRAVSLLRAVPFAFALLALVGLVRPASGQDQFEPNDDPNDATVVTHSGTTLQALISTDEDVDWFRFTHAAAGDVTITLTSIPAGRDYDIELYWLDPESSQLQFVAESINEAGEDELISGTAVAGDYFLVVFGFDGSFHPSDTYQASFTFQEGTTNSPPVVTILEPSGGEQYEAGTQQEIRYTLTDADDATLEVTIEHSTNNGTSWQGIASGSQATGTHSRLWNVPNSTYAQGRVRVVANDGSGPVVAVSNTFAVTEVSGGNNAIAVGTNSGTVGSTATVSVSLTNEDVVKGLQMDLLFDPSVVSFVGASPVSRAAAFSDSSRTVSSGRARVVLFPTGNQTIDAGSGAILNLSFQLLAAGTSGVTPTGLVLSGENGNDLAITGTAGSLTVTGGGGGNPQITLVAPAGGETFAGGSVTNVQWVASGGSGNLSVQIAYSANNGGNYTVQGTDPNNTGSFSWSVPNQATSQGRIRVTASDGANSASDESGAFTITVPSGGNSVAIGSISGEGGATVSLPLTLTNDEAVKALQFDLTFDESVATFTAANASGRGAAMVATIARVSAGRVRGVLRFENSTSLSAGTGEVASLRFTLVGGQGSQTTLTPTSLILSDLDAEAIPGVTAQAGVITVTSDPPSAPAVRVAALQNPGRTRHLTIIVTVAEGSGNAPTVTAGGQSVAMSQVASGVFQGTFFAPESAGSVTVNATDTAGGQVGSDSRTVSF